MRWNYKLTRIAGTDVRINLAFLLFLAWIAFAYLQRGGPAAAFQGVLFMLALFLCVLLHEFGHATAARHFGIRTPDITLYPIGGVARLESMPTNPRQELIIAIAGPMVNVVIAAVLLLMGAVVGYEDIEYIDTPRSDFLAKLASVNIALVLFNLIPAFPMDGGRVLRALLAYRMNYVRATDIAARIGQGIAVVFGVLGFFGNPMLIFIAIVIFQGAQQEAAMTHFRNDPPPIFRER